MWDPEANVQAICDDFYQEAFGPAADTMRGYYERFDGGHRPLVSDHLLALAHRDLAEASRLATHHPEVLRRLDDLKLYLHYVGLIRELDATPDGQARLDVVFRILNFAYRTRHRYIVHSSGIRHRAEHPLLLGKMALPEGWNWRKLRDKTEWYVGGDYTREETERIFQEGLARYAVQQFEERVFGEQLVPAGLDPAPDATPEPMTLRRSHRFVMLSGAGEPLTFRLLTGLYPQNRRLNQTRWQVTGVDGDEIASGREMAQVASGPANIIVVPVPKGTDGQAWRIRGLASKRLWLLNCPNYFATRPENLLIPRLVMW